MNRNMKPYNWNDVKRLSREQEVKELSKNNSSLCKYIETVRQVVFKDNLYKMILVMVNIFYT